MPKLPEISRNLKDLPNRVTYRQWVIMAVLFSCFMGLLVYFSLSREDSDAKNAEKAMMMQVVVAKQNIPERTILKEEMLKVIEVPADIVPQGAYTSVSEALEHPASMAIQQGDIVTDRKVYADVRMAGFTGTIPPNCRAVSVAITDITGMSGFAKAGDYVDIMVITGSKEDGVKGEILMQNVLLLGINKVGEEAARTSGSSEEKKTDGKEKTQPEGNIQGTRDDMKTATLALPLDQALKLAVSSQKGLIYLVLRPYQPTDLFTLDKEFSLPGDKKEPAEPVQAEKKEVTEKPEAPAPRTVPAAGAGAAVMPATLGTGRSIEVIRGVESSRTGVQEP